MFRFTYPAYCVFCMVSMVGIPIPYFVHHGSKSLMDLAKIYPVATIKICLEFAKMGQSTDKNKLQLSLSTNFSIVRMRMTSAGAV